jgi:flagellar basal-body rod modification protein FlgD
MHSVSSIYTMPTILSTLKASPNSTLQTSLTAKAKTASTANTTSNSNSTSSSNSGSALGSTFLSLLAQELQNQDPTAPVDSTAMVGQMISLNQLDQLISINQGITGSSSSSAGTTAAGQVQGAATTASDAALATANGGAASLLSPSTAGAATSQLPFDPNTMMPVASGNSAAMAATINSSLNAATIGLSGTNNNATGGK